MMFGMEITFMKISLMKFKIFLFWLLLVIGWNYRVPDATPLMDVIMAVIFSFISMLSNSILNED